MKFDLFRILENPATLAGLFMLSFLSPASAVLAGSSLILGESSGLAGGSILVAVDFSTTESLTAVQMDVHFDETLVRVGTAALPAGRVNHRIASSLIAAGITRVVVNSLENAPLADGTLVFIPVEFIETIPETDRSLFLGQVVFSNLDGAQTVVDLLPRVRLKRPLDGLELVADELVDLNSIAIDTDGQVSSVEFFAGTQSIGMATASPFNLQWTPTQTGQFAVSAIARDNDNFTATSSAATIAVIPETAFTVWRRTHFAGNDFYDPLLVNRLADPDHDGVNNLFEFAFDLDPKGNGRTGLPELGKTGDFITLTFRRNKSATLQNFTVEKSDDLILWDPISTAFSVVEDGGTFEILEAQVPVAAVDRTMFLRLRVEEEIP